MTVNPITSSTTSSLPVPTIQKDTDKEENTPTTDGTQELPRLRLQRLSLPNEATSLRTQMLGLIQDSIEQSQLGPSLLNAISRLASNLHLLEIEEETLLKQNAPLDASEKLNSATQNQQLSIFADLILLRLYNDPALSQISLDLGEGRTAILGDYHSIKKDCESMSILLEKRAPIEISFPQSKIKPPKTEKIIIKWGNELNGAIEIALTEAIDIKQLEKDTLKFILEQQSST